MIKTEVVFKNTEAINEIKRKCIFSVLSTCKFNTVIPLNLTPGESIYEIFCLYDIFKIQVVVNLFALF